MPNIRSNLSPKCARGYIYDAETQLYYCQSRYYDPALGRFLNADSFASTGQGILGNNMFAYCNNNPITNVDSCGNRCEAIDPSEVSLYGGITAFYLSTYLSYSSRTKEKTESKVSLYAKGSDKSKRLYTVYFLCAEGDPLKDIIYVGRVKTENFSARMRYHQSKGRQHVGSVGGLLYTECRILEQAGMAYNHSISHGNILNNQIRGISVKKGPKYIEAVWDFNESTEYPDNPYLPRSYIANQFENWLLNLGS